MRCKKLNDFKILEIFWEFLIFWELFGIFFGFFWKFFRNSLGFLRDIFGDLLRNFLKIVILGEFLGNMKRIDLFVKILVFVKILSQWRRKEEGRKDKKYRSLEVQGASSLHLKRDIK